MQNSSGNCRHLHTHLKTVAQKTTPIGLSRSTTNRPQASHYENFASMEAMRVRVRGGQRERGVGCGRGRRQRRGPVWRRVSDDIRATLVDHVINHGLSMREAGQRVHPNLSRYTLASIIKELLYVFSVTLFNIFCYRQFWILMPEFIYVNEAGFNLANTSVGAVT